jgi:hypothetical protein
LAQGTHSAPLGNLGSKTSQKGSTGRNSNLSPLARVVYPSEATWEFIDEVKLRFLSFNLEDKVFLKGRELLLMRIAKKKKTSRREYLKRNDRC